MLELEDEQIIIASTLIALENNGVSKIHNLSMIVYDISRNIGMKRFSGSNFNEILMSLCIPVLKNADLISCTSSNEEEIDPDSICRLSKKAADSMKKIRIGYRTKSRNADEQEIFDNIFLIINGHLDETHERMAFKNHIKKGLHIPGLKFGH